MLTIKKKFIIKITVKGRTDVFSLSVSLNYDHVIKVSAQIFFTMIKCNFLPLNCIIIESICK